MFTTASEAVSPLLLELSVAFGGSVMTSREDIAMLLLFRPDTFPDSWLSLRTCLEIVIYQSANAIAHAIKINENSLPLIQCDEKLQNEHIHL